MKEVTELLAQLAAKLGTTVEYLWKVLVKQAPIEGVVILIQYGILGICVYLWIKLLRWAMKEADNTETLSFVAPTILGIPLAVFLGIAFFSLSNTAAAFLNPEYWALQQILKQVGR